MRIAILTVLLLATGCERKPTPHFLCRMDRSGTADPLLCRPEPLAGSFHWDEATCQLPTEGLKDATPHRCNRQRIAFCFDPRLDPSAPLEPVCLLNERACTEHRDRILAAVDETQRSPCLKLQPNAVAWAHEKQTWPSR